MLLCNDVTFANAQVEKLSAANRRNISLDKDGTLRVMSSVHGELEHEPSRQGDKSHLRKASVRINVGNITQLPEFGLKVSTRIALMGEKRAKGKVAKLFEQAQYTVVSELPDQSGDDATEPGAILAPLRRIQNETKDAVLVLVGDDMDADPQLPSLLQGAIDMGAKVRVWTWSACTSPALLHLAKAHPRSVELSPLDQFRGVVAYSEGDVKWGLRQHKEAQGMAVLAVMRRRERQAKGLLTHVVEKRDNSVFLADSQQPDSPADATRAAVPAATRQATSSATGGGSGLPPGPYNLEPEAKKMPVYIFVDNSNIFGGAQLMTTARKTRPPTPLGRPRLLPPAAVPGHRQAPTTSSPKPRRCQSTFLSTTPTSLEGHS